MNKAEAKRLVLSVLADYCDFIADNPPEALWYEDEDCTKWRSEKDWLRITAAISDLNEELSRRSIKENE